MRITNGNLFGLVNMYDRLNRFFGEDLWTKALKMALHPALGGHWTDIHETKDAYVFKVDLPDSRRGRKSGIHGDTLIMRGEGSRRKRRKMKMPPPGAELRRFERSFTIPKNVDPKRLKPS